MILLVIVPVLLAVWAMVTLIAHTVRRRQLAFRIRWNLGYPKAPQPKHRYIARDGKWKGPGVAETLKRLAEPNGLDWIHTIETIEHFYRTGQFSRAKAVGALNRLEGKPGPVGVVPPPVNSLRHVRNEDGELFIPTRRPDPSRRETR